MFPANRPTDRSSSRSRSVGPRGATTPERRSRRRLRDLCDEVLASYRVASGEDLFSESDRAVARTFLMKVTPQNVAR
jgi:hypothetical protein